MKSGVLSKLTAQVSDYYEVCYNLIVTTNLKNLIPKVTLCYKISIAYSSFFKNITLDIEIVEVGNVCGFENGWFQGIGLLRRGKKTKE
jgi:hypothetical protein